MNNLDLIITDNHIEMEKIGRRIVALKPEIYTDKIKNIMIKQIDSRLKNLTPKEKESVFYRSIYDYWVYVSLIYESITFGFADKSHEEKSAYITKKNFTPYYLHLNNKKVARKTLANKYNSYKSLKYYYARDVILIQNENSYETFKDFIQKHSEFVV